MNRKSEGKLGKQKGRARYGQPERSEQCQFRRMLATPEKFRIGPGVRGSNFLIAKPWKGFSKWCLT
jgi:hypothetical protein